MKGQYLAIESVLTFGMGIMVALGIITAFSSYKSRVIEKTEEKGFRRVKAEIKNAVINLQPADSGNIQLDFPEEIGGSSYTVILNEKLKIISGKETYRYDLNSLNENFEFRGSIKGGEAQIFKREREYILRAG